MLNTFATAHIKALVTSSDTWTEGHEQYASRVVSGLPKGARLIHVSMTSPHWINGTTMSDAILVYEHPSWDEVPFGNDIPYVNLKICSTDVPAWLSAS